MQTKYFHFGEGGRIRTTWPDLEFGRCTIILPILLLRAKLIYLFTLLYGENRALNSMMLAIQMEENFPRVRSNGGARCSCSLPDKRNLRRLTKKLVPGVGEDFTNTQPSLA